MATRERMPSLSDSPPPIPRAEPAPSSTVASSSSSVSRSDIAPRSKTPPPGALPELPKTPASGEGEESAPFPPGAFSPDDAIDEQIADLERWAVANERREKKESIRFWVLRGTAFLSAVGAAIGGPLGQPQAATVLAGVAALFIAIDSAWPSSASRNPYRRAVYDLRALQNTIKLRWDKVRLAHPDPTGSKRVAHALALLDAISAKRDEVGKYLGTAEASAASRK